MICDGKKLAAQLGREVKKGWELYIDGEEIQIITADWRFQGYLNEIGNETLAAIVLQLGTVPRSCCMSLGETKVDGVRERWQQDLLPDVFFTQLAEDWQAGAEMDKCTFTSLRLGSSYLFQLPGGRILGAEILPAITPKESRVGTAQGDAAIGWMDDSSQIWFRANRPPEDSVLWPKWRALESVVWTEAEP